MPDFSYQLYSSRNFPPLADTLRMVAAAGYAQVEGYGGLYEDESAIETLKVGLGETGLKMPTAHMSFETIRDDPQRAIATAKALGVETVFVPAVSERVRDAAGWAQFGQDLAEAGKPLQDAGLGFGWHNHDFEFADLGGADLPLELILAGSDDLGLELDIAWVHVAGHDPLAWIDRYADRIVSAHIKDVAPQGENADEDGWSDVGHGILDWVAIAAALGKTGVQWHVMEHDNPSDDQRFASRSITAAQGIFGGGQ